jgi:hypothetical protein
MKYFILSLVLLVICSGAAVAQDNSTWMFVTAAEDKVNVEVWLATEHVPADEKAGMVVDLSRVQGKTQTGTGLVSYSTAVVTRGCEVVSVLHADKPKEPEQAVKVELSVTKGQAKLIEAVKSRLVTVVESEGGKSETTRKPATLRLEPAKPM